MTKNFIIASILIIIIVGITLAYVGGLPIFDVLFSTEKQEARDMNIEIPSVSIPPSAQPVAPVPQSPPSVVITNCGTAGPVTFTSESGAGKIMFSKIKADAATKRAWECFTDKLQVCSAAEIKVSAQGREDKYSISRKIGDFCEVSGPKVSVTDGKVTNAICRISLRYINFAYSQSEKLYPDQKFAKGFTTMGAITAGGGAISYPDGTKDVISCQ